MNDGESDYGVSIKYTTQVIRDDGITDGDRFCDRDCLGS